MDLPGAHLDSNWGKNEKCRFYCLAMNIWEASQKCQASIVGWSKDEGCSHAKLRVFCECASSVIVLLLYFWIISCLFVSQMIFLLSLHLSQEFMYVVYKKHRCACVSPVYKFHMFKQWKCKVASFKPYQLKWYD